MGDSLLSHGREVVGVQKRPRKEKVATLYSRIRKFRGWFQIDVAEELGITRKTLSNYETGKYDPPKEIVLKMDEFYKCDGELIKYWLKAKFSWKKKNTIWTAIQTVFRKFLSYFKLYQVFKTKSMR